MRNQATKINQNQATETKINSPKTESEELEEKAGFTRSPEVARLSGRKSSNGCRESRSSYGYVFNFEKNGVGKI